MIDELSTNIAMIDSYCLDIICYKTGSDDRTRTYDRYHMKVPH
jgi:hypothetical protein